MPVIKQSTYDARGLLKNPHYQTIYPAIFRRLGKIPYRRERMETPDGDFMDIDWYDRGADRLLIALHGLEGNAQRPYMQGMIHCFSQQGWNAAAMNMRACSGETNRKLYSYHTGKTDDLAFFVNHILSLGKYQEIVLVGFSAGGNIVLKYLGEQGVRVEPIIKAAVAFSVPCDLGGCALRLDHDPANRFYLWQFLYTLKAKAKSKAMRFPGAFDVEKVRRSNSFFEFDEYFTAPVNGFKDAWDYWAKNSSMYFIPEIKIPTLLVNALDDPFLSEKCFPYQQANDNPFFFLETPVSGGHVGFMKRNSNGVYWAELRAYEFIRSIMKDI